MDSSQKSHFHTLSLLLGSNHPRREAMMERARCELGKRLDIVALSDVVATPDVKRSGNHYLNQIVVVATALDVAQVQTMAKDIEARLGRTPLSKAAGTIEIDIDIVDADGRTLRPQDASQPYYKLCLPSLSPVAQ